MNTKKCTRCEEILPIDHFGVKATNQLQSACRACQRLISSEWYANNKRRQVDNAKRNNNKFRTGIQTWKRTLSCSKCTETFHACLDFHHLDGDEKEKSISSLTFRGASLVGIVKEINKCIVLCSNCHRKVHAGVLDVSDVLPLNITVEELQTYQSLAVV